MLHEGDTRTRNFQFFTSQLSAAVGRKIEDKVVYLFLTGSCCARSELEARYDDWVHFNYM